MTIKRTGDKYTVFSEKGKRLSKPTSKKAAKKRLGQIEYFKQVKKSGVNLSASAMTLKVDSEKANQANRINVDTDAYKAFLNKSSELRCGIQDDDRYLLEQKKNNEYSVQKGLHSNGFVVWGYGLWRNQIK